MVITSRLESGPSPYKLSGSVFAARSRCLPTLCGRATLCCVVHKESSERRLAGRLGSVTRMVADPSVDYSEDLT